MHPSNVTEGAKPSDRLRGFEDGFRECYKETGQKRRENLPLQGNRINLQTLMTDIIFRNESYKIIGAAMEVHRKLGPGFLESVYSEALELEFQKAGISYEKDKKLVVYYEGKPLKKFFKADYLCFDNIIVEIKASAFIHNDNNRQTINYLNAVNKPVGLLINFGEASLKWKRFVNSKALRTPSA